MDELLWEYGSQRNFPTLPIPDISATSTTIEIDHITPKGQGGGEELSHNFALYRHCQDQRHAQRVQGTYDKGQITEEPDDANGARPVLKPSGEVTPSLRLTSIVTKHLKRLRRICGSFWKRCTTPNASTYP